MDNDPSSVPDAQPASDRARAVLSFGIPIALAVVVFAVFARLCRADFITLDDNIHLYANPFYKQAGSLGTFWKTPYQGLYIPLAYTILGLLAPFGRLAFPDPSLSDTGALYNPHFFHALNLAVHIANALAVYFLLKMLVKRDVAAAVGALAFAFHPLQVESVAWISEFRGLFAGFFSLTALIAYVAAARSRGGARAGLYGLWAIGACCAVLCKPSSVCLPVMAFAIDVLLLKRPWRQALAPTALLLVVFIPFIRYTAGLQPELGTNYTPIWTRPFIATDALAFYLAKFLAPVNLVLDYGRQPGRVMAEGVAWWTWIAPAVLAFAVWRLRRRAPWLVGASLATLFALLPVLGLAPFRFQDLSTVADRYMYLAMLGPAIAIAYLWAGARPVDARAAVVVILMAWMGLTIHQIRYWDNSITVLTHSLRSNPDSPLLQSNLAGAYEAHGQTTLALEHLNRSIAEDPHYFFAQLNRAQIELALGQYNAAAADFEHMEAEWPKSRLAPLGIGEIYEHQGKLDAAQDAYTKLVNSAPDFEPARVRLGVILMQKQQYPLARAQFQLALRSNPFDAEAWTGLGNVASVKGDVDGALAAYSRAESIDPTAYEADYDLGALLLGRNMYAQAAKSLRNASRARPGDADAHDLLGVALYDCGDRPAALREFQQALKIDPRHQEAMRHLMALYSVQ